METVKRVPSFMGPLSEAAEQEVVRVFLMDGSYKAVKLNPSKTTIEELWIIIAEKLMLPESSAPLFFLWGIEGDLELLLYTHTKIADLKEDWAHFVKRYDPPKHNVMQTLKKVPSMGKLDGGSTIGRSSSNQKVDSAVSKEQEFKIVFRTTSVVPLAEEMKANDPASVHLFYIQAVHNVIHSNYPCDIRTAIKLAGIQLQITVGDRNPEIHKSGYLEGSLGKFVPEHLINQLKLEEWEPKLFLEHQGLSGHDSHSLKLQYLNLVRRWPYYGSTFFKAKYEQKDSFYKQDFEGTVRVGVNEQGLHLISPKEMKVVTYSFEELANWDSQKGVFYFEATDSNNSSGGVLSKIKKKPNKFYQFKANQAELINDLLCDWVAAFQEAEDQEIQAAESKRDKRKPNKKVDFN